MKLISYESTLHLRCLSRFSEHKDNEGKNEQKRKKALKLFVIGIRYFLNRKNRFDQIELEFENWT